MKHFRIGEFASQAGVTLRTLRYYDRIGLLRPTARSETQQRLYTEPDYARLQQILTLKLLGLTLHEIKEVLASDWGGMEEILARQQHVLQSKVQHLLALIESIQQAREMLRESPQLDIEQFINIIKVVNMNMQSDWLSHFVSQEQQDQLVDVNARQSFEAQKQVGEALQNLFQDILASLEKDVHDPAVQKLVERWDALMGQFSAVGPGVVPALNEAYSHMDQVPVAEPARAWAHNVATAADFIQRARDAAA
ncbi:MAG: MerR family transcriptional regulator [Anaerolineae bacterium]